MKSAKKFKKFKSLSDLFDRCQVGDEQAQRICIGALQNLGCDHLANMNKQRQPTRPKWYWFWQGLNQYVTALVCEYGESETKAERGVLAEVNHVWDCCDNVSLT